MEEGLVTEVRNTYTELFDSEPILVFAPGRINLIGDHTDYNDGWVFPAAINLGIYLAIGAADSKNCRVVAKDKSEHFEFDLHHVKAIPKGNWRNYVLGVVGEILKAGHELEGFNAVFSGNIPSGSGLSSSAALENSFVFGLNTLYDLRLSKRDMIFISQHAEHHYVGVKCGIMDQYASMFGERDKALLLDCRFLKSITYSVNFEGYSWVLINSNVKHDLADSAYNDRRSACERVARTLSVETLRDLSMNKLHQSKNVLETSDYDKARFVLEENNRVLEFGKALEISDLQAIGSLLFESHEGLKTQYEVSCEELDFLVDKARSHPLVIGARMMGGGFGGCTINLVQTKGQLVFADEVKREFTQRFGSGCDIIYVSIGEGTQILI